MSIKQARVLPPAGRQRGSASSAPRSPLGAAPGAGSGRSFTGWFSEAPAATIALGSPAGWRRGRAAGAVPAVAGHEARAGGRAGPRALRPPSARGRGLLPRGRAGGGSGRLETVLGVFIIDHQLTPPGQKALTAPSGCWKSEITSLSLKSGALLASPWRRGG